MDDKYTVKEGVLKYKGRIWVGDSNGVKLKVIEAIHGSAIFGHSGVQASYQRAKGLFYWMGMKKDFKGFIKDVCKRYKSETVPYPGMLQPLSVLEKPWSQVTMDFIEALPNAEGKSVIWVVVDRMTKYSYSFLSNTHIQLRVWQKSTLIKSTIYMDFLKQLLVIEMWFFKVILKKLYSS